MYFCSLGSSTEGGPWAGFDSAFPFEVPKRDMETHLMNKLLVWVCVEGWEAGLGAGGGATHGSFIIRVNMNSSNDFQTMRSRILEKLVLCVCVCILDSEFHMPH